MKGVTLSSPEDKNTVRSAVPTSKIFTAAVARLYVASPDPSKWTYTRIWGAAVFCVDKAKKNSFFIRMVDLENNRGVIWEQELYEGFEYIKDASFFHSFETDDCLTALEFVDETEAETFYKKLQGRQSLSSKATSQNVLGGSKHILPSLHSNKKRLSKIDKNHIGMPADFRHVGHIGYTQGKGFSVQNNDPEKTGIIEQLKALGISAEEINENQDLIDQFLQQNTAQEQTAPSVPQFNSRPPPPQTTSPPPPPPMLQTRKKTPPPPPPPGRLHASPPPPPPPRRPLKQQTPTAPPPPPPTRNVIPPPPPPVGNRIRAVPPPPPGRNNIPPPSMPSAPIPPMSSVPPPPPPPPPGPPMMNARPTGNVPAAPPPPPMNGYAPPPPPPPPMSNTASAPPPPSGIPPPVTAPGRTDLMASIRAAGGFGTLKQSGRLRHTEVEDHSSPAIGSTATGVAAGAAAGVAGGTLASSLADVLKQRQQAMQSDDEDDDDDEWD
ncbi:hypothetical protein BD770DRAFT_380098 [Pilaira anomala]|nr:hypothetical protein BD770DRAFT_380098 [Pilaira anomala]